MKIVKEESGLLIRGIASYGDVFFNNEEFDELNAFIQGISLPIKIDGQELENENEKLKAIVEELQSIISKLRLEHEKDIETVTQRLRSAHLFDLRITLGVMDRLVNTRDSVALTPKSIQ